MSGTTATPIVKALLALMPMVGLVGLVSACGQRVPPTERVLHTETATVGPEGGTITFPLMIPLSKNYIERDFIMEIPQNALPEPTTITITALDQGVRRQYARSPVFDFQPDGLTFEAPVEVTVPFRNLSELGPAALFLESSTGARQPLNQRDRNGTITGTIHHFSTCFVAGQAADASFCPPPVTPDPVFCTIGRMEGGTDGFTWGISELGDGNFPDGTCTQPITSVAFTSLHPTAFFIIETLDIRNAVNIRTIDPKLIDLTVGDGWILPPHDFGSTAWRSRWNALRPVENRSEFWRFGYESYSVWPEDETQCMDYDACLTVREAGTQNRTTICAEYRNCRVGGGDGDDDDSPPVTDGLELREQPQTSAGSFKNCTDPVPEPTNNGVPPGSCASWTVDEVDRNPGARSVSASVCNWELDEYEPGDDYLQLRLGVGEADNVYFELDSWDGPGTYDIRFILERAQNHQDWSTVATPNAAFGYSNKPRIGSDDYGTDNGVVTISENGDRLSGTFEFEAMDFGDVVRISNGSFTNVPQAAP